MDTNQTLIGRTLAGRFRILRCIGKGGMAAVFAAVQEDGEPRDVAIKVMKQELMRDRTVLRRFQREAKAASKLGHPNTIRVIDFGVDGEDAYIAMELAKGKDLLQSLAEQRPMHQYRAVNIVAQVCAALSAAHAMGIVHRDLKPENIMLVPEASAPFGELVKVLDFGIAKILDLPDKPDKTNDDSDSGPSTITKSALTRVGTIVGTPAYMSPEQCRGGEIDGRSDLYACGVLLYQLSTGQVPFLGETPLHTAMRHIHAPPRPPTELRRDLHPTLERIILRALAKWPADRPSSADELAEELLAVLPELPDHPERDQPPSTEAARREEDAKRRSLSSDHTQLALVPSDTARAGRKLLDGEEPISEIEPSETDPLAARVGDEEEPRTKVRDTLTPVAKLGAPLKAQLKYQSPQPGTATARQPPDDDDDDDVRTSIKSPESVIDAVTRPNPQAPRPANAPPTGPARRLAPPTLMSGRDPSSGPSEASTAPRRGRRGPLNSTAVMEPSEGAIAIAAPPRPVSLAAAVAPSAPVEDDDDEQPTALRPAEEVQAAIRAGLRRGMPPLGSRPASIVDGPVVQIDRPAGAAARPPGARGTLRMRPGERPVDGLPSSDNLEAVPTPKKIGDDTAPPASSPQSLEVSLSELNGIERGSSPDLGRAQPPVKNTLVSAGSSRSGGASGPAAGSIAVVKPAVRTQPMSAIQQTVKMGAGARPELRRPDSQGHKSQISLTARRVIEELPGTTGVLLGVGIGVLASIVFAIVIAVLSR